MMAKAIKIFQFLSFSFFAFRHTVFGDGCKRPRVKVENKFNFLLMATYTNKLEEGAKIGEQNVK